MSIAALSTSPPAPSTWPLWLDVSFGTVVMTLIFGVLPAFLRLQVRRIIWHSRNKSLAREGEQSTGSGPIGSEAPIPPEQDPETVGPITPTEREALISTKRNINPQQATNSGLRHPRQGEPDKVIGERRQRNVSALRKLPTEALANSETLGEARTYQYPIARSVRALQLAADPKEQYQALIDVSEALSITAGVTVAAWLRIRAPDHLALVSLRDLYVSRGVSQGSWHEVLAQASRVAVDDESAPRGLRALRAGRKRNSIMLHLNALVQERNRWAHGARPRDAAEAAMRVNELQPTLESALDAARFLLEMPWILTQSSSYQPRTQEFRVLGFRAMGDHPEFERQRLTSPIPLADDTFYILGQDQPIELTPFVVIRYCEECRQREVWHADKLDAKSGTVLKSFDRGHGIFDNTLDDEILRLTERPGANRSAG
jgi:hypothetical protein